MADLLGQIAALESQRRWPTGGLRCALEYASQLNPGFVADTIDTRTGERGPCLLLERPRECAVGLLGWDYRKARATGLSGTRETLEWISSLSADEQARLAARFFERSGAQFRSASDFLLVLLGWPSAVGKEASFPLAKSDAISGNRKDARIYQSLKHLDRDADGVVRVEDIRSLVGGGDDAKAASRVF